jgi:hypothetical protein
MQSECEEASVNANLRCTLNSIVDEQEAWHRNQHPHKLANVANNVLHVLASIRTRVHMYTESQNTYTSGRTKQA